MPRTKKRLSGIVIERLVQRYYPLRDAQHDAAFELARSRQIRPCSWQRRVPPSPLPGGPSGRQAAQLPARQQRAFGAMGPLIATMVPRACTPHQKTAVYPA